ncbi:MAG: arginine--tRNA ligase [Fimbriimonadaceae bacterium]|nr:arginine--tRNA ligase [Fimbriimonadaceae bacterium]
MIREELSQKIAAALASLVASGRLTNADYGTPEIADTKNPEHGDYACNIALTASKKAGMNPRDFGALLLEALAGDADLSAELAGPGFLNLRLRPQFISDYVARILSVGTSLARSPSSGKKINVEYVSVNPNGPITVGSGRGAAFGSCLANVLEAAGNAVHREYYINDGVNSEQMRLFAESVKALVEGKLIPEKGYKGDYVAAVAEQLIAGLSHSASLDSPKLMDFAEMEREDLGFNLSTGIAANILRNALKEGSSAIRFFRAEPGITAVLFKKENGEFEQTGQVPDEQMARVYAKFVTSARLPHRDEVLGLSELSLTVLLDGEKFPVKVIRERWKTDGELQILLTGTEDISWFQSKSQDIMLDKQRLDLATFGVEFDTWFSEQSLHDQKAVDACLQELLDKQVADDEPYRLVLKMAKGGKIEEVERQIQPIEDDDDSQAENPLPNPPPQAGEGTGSNAPDPGFSSQTGVTPEPVPSPAGGGGLGRGAGGTVWLRSTKFADDMDRVLRRRDGRLTYIASDVAYHRDKLTDASGVRGTGPVDKMITILGPDHHGYIGRLTAVVAALLEKTDNVPLASRRHPEASEGQGSRRDASGTFSEIDAQIYRSPEERDACIAALQEAKEKLEVVIFQIVRFVKEGKPAPMRKRDGNIYALIDLIDELGKTMAPEADKAEQQRIGRDVARFFYLMRSHETHMDFDIDLATKQSDENPVFYVQYAHARICSVIDKAKDAGISADYASANFSLLRDPRELALIKKILDLPFEVRRCAEDYGVHRLTTFAVELARSYHHFYDGCRVVQTDQPALSQARMALCEAARIGLKGVFDILGISAPERMERSAEPTPD